MAKDAETQTQDGQAALAETRPAALSPLDRARANQLARDYRSLSFQDARAAAEQDHAFVQASEAGIGFRKIEHAEDKKHLVGVELMVLPGWQVNPSTKYPGNYFTTCYIKTALPIPQLGGGTEFLVNDGSKGIAAQLADLRQRYEARGVPDQAVYCLHGLKESTYQIMDKVFDDAGNPVMDPITRRQVTTPRLDPVTEKPVGEGTTFYLDESA